MTPAQTAAEALTNELNTASRALNRCACGSKAVMRYEPGCTTIACIAERTTKAALPDWQPTALAHQWNDDNP